GTAHALSSGGQHNLAGRLPLPKHVQSTRRIFNVKTLGDMRFQLAFLKPVKELRKRLPYQLRLARVIRSPVEADHINVFYQRDIGRDLRYASGGKANDNNAAFP